MKLIIDISEDVYTRLFDNSTEDYTITNDDLFTIAKSIRKGTPLPKNHGRLIDADAIDTRWSDPEVSQTLDEAPTIIEADGGGKCTKKNCPMNAKTLNPDCNLKGCPYRTEIEDCGKQNL